MDENQQSTGGVARLLLLAHCDSGRPTFASSDDESFLTVSR
jgi:hypothetical protein